MNKCRICSDTNPKGPRQEYAHFNVLYTCTSSYYYKHLGMHVALNEPLGEHALTAIFYNKSYFHSQKLITDHAKNKFSCMS